MISGDVLVEVLRWVGALLVGIIGGWFTFRFQRQKRIVQYENAMFPLLLSDSDFPPCLQVLADKSLLTGSENDKGATVAVQKLTATTIRLDNVGNEVAEDFTVDIELPETAKILQTQTNPRPSDGFPLRFSTPERAGNTATLHVPYLNPHQRIFAAVTAADLPGESQPSVRIVGKGVESRPRKYLRHILSLFLLLVLFGVLATVLTNPSFVAQIPEGLARVIGVTIITKKTVVWSAASQVISIGLLLVAVFFVGRPIVRGGDPPPPWKFD